VPPQEHERNAGGNLPRLRSLQELEDLLASADRGLYVRYSEGYQSDVERGSLDTESGLELPGLSVNPLNPEDWWTRPRRDWLARQLCQYKDLKEKNPNRIAWVLSGRDVGRGPDCEPLLVDVEPLAVLEDALLGEAQEVYEERFEAGRGPED
jgi:hypothetical protein